MRTSHAGQALTELAFISTIAVVFVTLAAHLISRHWQRSKCAYLVFEKTHARLTTRPEPRTTTWIEIQEQPNYLQGTGTCGVWVESVRLPRLEAAQWP